MAGVINHLADAHLFHKKAALWRGFSSVEEHNDVVMDSIITQCGARDVLILGGDTCFAEGWKFDELVKRHAPKKFLHEMSIIMKNAGGNHDRQRLSQSKYIRAHAALFEHEFKGNRIIATHIPIHSCSFPRWNINVHGHLHDHQVNEPQYVNVSWEQCLRPVTITEVYEKYERQMRDAMMAHLDNVDYVKPHGFFK